MYIYMYLLRAGTCSKAFFLSDECCKLDSHLCVVPNAEEKTNP